MTDWLRLWHDMPTDPKWRVVARKSGQPLACVIAVFNLLLVNASTNASQRGTLSNWDDEDAAAALDMDPEAVAAIVSAMQGKVIEGSRLSGWERRQPKREDGTAAARKEAWKERQTGAQNAPERTGTQENAPERAREEKSREDIADADAQASASVHLADRCLEAAGLSNDPKAVLWPIRPIYNCIRDGAVLSEDVLPTLRRLRAEGRRFGSWSYPCQAIMDAKAAREAPAPEGRATGPPNRQTRTTAADFAVELDALNRGHHDHDNPREPGPPVPRLAYSAGHG